MPVSEFLKIITSAGDGQLLKNIFYENVRDFQGASNTVNSEIASTLTNPDEQDKFILLNNGITIVAKIFQNIKSSNYEIANYFIVNGCQTSTTIFNHKDILLSSRHQVPVKIIHTQNEELISKIIRSTNRQTPVPDEAFVSLEKFHKRLQQFYKTFAVDAPHALYSDAGLEEVSNPSALFLADRREDVSGAVVFAGIEGTRPVLVEIQALVSPSTLGTPRRAVVGWDSTRLAMVLAVLEARCGVQIGMNDIYLNVAGGLRISEPAADLAVAAALLSALTATPAPAEAVFFGEIGLAGEVRAVSQTALRLKEAGKLGFAKAFAPKGRGKNADAKTDIPVTRIAALADLLPLFSK